MDQKQSKISCKQELKRRNHIKRNGKINILHITLYLEIGGLETLVVEMCRHIDREKFNLSVLCLIEFDPAYKKQLEKIGISVNLIEKHGPFDFKFFLKIIKFITREGVDIIHSHSGCFFNAAMCAFFAKTKGIIYTAHGMPVETGMQSRIEDFIAAAITDRIVAVSEEIKEHMSQLFPTQKKKIMLIINGVDTGLYSPSVDSDKLNELKTDHNIPLEKVIIGTVGRIEDVKNYQMLIRSFAGLLRNNPNRIHLIFIGDGSERENLEKMSDKLGVRNNISFLGIQYELYNIVPMIDIFVLSSLTEGTSVSLLEAQSCGIPAVVTNVEMRSQMHHNARSMVLNNYNINSMVNSYEKLYELMMAS
jgi:glycosyltransferase involved in cell wall biosynthesis